MIGTIPTETEAEKARVEKIKQMGPEKIAPVCGYLLSDAAKDVTGQIFGVRKNEIFLFSQNRPLRSVQRSEGWTPQTIAEHAMPALKGSFSSSTAPRIFSPGIRSEIRQRTPRIAPWLRSEHQPTGSPRTRDIPGYRDLALTMTFCTTAESGSPRTRRRRGGAHLAFPRHLRLLL